VSSEPLPSPILGPKGNQEFLILLQTPADQAAVTS